MKNTIRVERAKKRMSQQDLADATQTSRQTIHCIETGQTEPRLSIAMRISKFFGVPIEKVFEFEEN